MKPINGYIIAVKEELETKTPSGLILQGSANLAPPVFKVVATSDEQYSQQTESLGLSTTLLIKVGDKLLVNGEKITKATIDNVEYHFFKESSVIAIV